MQYPARDVRVCPGAGYRHTVRGYDYMSDNLADGFVVLIGCNTLTIRRLQ